MARILTVGHGAAPVAAILSVLLLLVAYQSPACAQTNVPTISGRAFYTSALSSCQIWSDVVNQDGMLEPGEPRAATGESGAYLMSLNSFDGVPMDAALAPVVSGTVPEGTCVDSASLEQPAMQLTAPSGCTILSPLGTLTAELVKGENPLVIRDEAAALLQEAFGSKLVAASQISFTACAPDPELALVNGHEGARELLMAERLVKGLAVAGGAAIASGARPEVSSAAVVSGLAAALASGDLPVTTDPAACGPVDLCSRAVVAEVLRQAPAPEGQNGSPMDLVAWQVVPTFIADSLRLIHDSSEGAETPAALLEATALAAATVEAEWLAQAPDLSAAAASGSPQELSVALAPVEKDTLVALIQNTEPLPGRAVWYNPDPQQPAVEPPGEPLPDTPPEQGGADDAEDEDPAGNEEDGFPQQDEVLTQEDLEEAGKDGESEGSRPLWAWLVIGAASAGIIFFLGLLCCGICSSCSIYKNNKAQKYAEPIHKQGAAESPLPSNSSKKLNAALLASPETASKSPPELYSAYAPENDYPPEPEDLPVSDRISSDHVSLQIDTESEEEQTEAAEPETRLTTANVTEVTAANLTETDSENEFITEPDEEDSVFQSSIDEDSDEQDELLEEFDSSRASTAATGATQSPGPWGQPTKRSNPRFR